MGCSLQQSSLSFSSSGETQQMSPYVKRRGGKAVVLCEGISGTHLGPRHRGHTPSMAQRWFLSICVVLNKAQSAAKSTRSQCWRAAWGWPGEELHWVSLASSPPQEGTMAKNCPGTSGLCMLPWDQQASLRQSIQAFSGTNFTVKYLHVFNYSVGQADPWGSSQCRARTMDALDRSPKRCLVGQKNPGFTRVKDGGLGINWHLPSSYDLRWILYFLSEEVYFPPAWLDELCSQRSESSDGRGSSYQKMKANIINCTTSKHAACSCWLRLSFPCREAVDNDLISIQ